MVRRGESASAGSRGGRSRGGRAGARRSDHGLLVGLRRNGLVRWFLRPVGRALFVTFALVLATVTLVWAARSEARVRASLRLDPGQCRVEAGPGWITPAVLSEVRSSLASLGPFDLAAAHSSELLAGALEQGCAWVRSVRKLTKLYPNQARVAMQLRRPVAQVAMDGMLVALDVEGVVLPPAALDLPWPGGGSIPRLTGVRPAPCPPVGCRVPAHPEIMEGLRVAADLASRPLGSKLDPVLLVSIDVSGVPVVKGEAEPGGRRCEIVLRTQGGVEIWWGRSPSSPLGAVELSLDEKLTRLNMVLRRYPGLRGLERVCVFYDDPTIVKAQRPRQLVPSKPGSSGG